MTSPGLLTALQLIELGAEIRAQRHRRENPAATEGEVRREVAAWLSDRTQAPHGDAIGRPGNWPRHR